MAARTGGLGTSRRYSDTVKFDMLYVAVPTRHPAIAFVRGLDYSIHGKALHATDQVDITLVKPRVRKYETAGAASA